MANFDQFFTSILESFGKHPAVIYGERVITYRELQERVNKLAHALLEMGVKKNDNIGLCEYNTPEFMEVTAAAWKIAARAVPINYRFKEWELKYVIDDAEMSALFFAEDLTERFKNIRPDLKTVKNYVVMGDQGESREPDMLYYEDLFKGSRPRHPSCLGAISRTTISWSSCTRAERRAIRRVWSTAITRFLALPWRP